ncbi:MAG TPA: SIMPL domain-containing protein [Acidimicrobiales bacterium]|nr:SIMPL domain-containing protein [Acidimicrobiales bacterium]
MVPRAAVLGTLGAMLVAGTSIVTWRASGGQAGAQVKPTEAAQGSPGACRSGATTLTVNGQATVQGTPDLLTLVLGVETQAPSAAAAMSSNATKANALISVLQADGVASSHIQTSGLSVQANYSSNGQRITGYQVDNDVTVTTTNLGTAGQLIDDAARAAGNAIRISSITFSLQDDAALAGQARAQAVRQTRSEAQAMANASGMALGPLCSLQDNSAPVEPPTVSLNGGGPAATPSTPIEAGTEQVTANVTAVYELVPSVTGQ